MNHTKTNGQKVADLVRDAGGRIVGRTRLQKIAYLLELAGHGEGFHFDYHHYGPYSEELSRACSAATGTKLIVEEEHPTTWGGSYSTFELCPPDSAPDSSPDSSSDSSRQKLAETGAQANAIELELAATAAYFAHKGCPDPWEETQSRKPDKAADGRLQNAQKLYRKLVAIEDKLPHIQ